MGAATEVTRLYVTDVSAQKEAWVNDIEMDSTVGELIAELLAEMRLPRQDAEGNPLIYQARLEREGRQLHGSERLADVVQSGDRITLLPNIDAGGRRG